jgi:hypothetical protein
VDTAEDGSESRACQVIVADAGLLRSSAKEGLAGPW